VSAAVTCEHLTRRFGALSAVDDVSLNVPTGEIFGLIGPDGAGKTTLMRLFAGILTPTSGRAQVAGYDVVADPEGVKRHIGYLSQVFSLYTDLTVQENLDFVADIYGESRAWAQQAKAEMLALTGLAPFAGRLAGRLSGGMKQKLALMCALIHRPRVLLLDEPTTGVDPLSRRDFWRILADLPAQGVTVVLSSPYMDEAARCHRLALIDRGRVLAVGSAPEIAALAAGTVVEVVAADVRGTARRLGDQPHLAGLTVYGDALHVRLSLPRAAALAQVRTALADTPVEAISEAEPSLEDAFVELVSR
jgi:ABC-2 type transport system ATP-binding protein